MATNLTAYQHYKNVNEIKSGLISTIYNAFRSLITTNTEIKPRQGGPITSWTGKAKASASADRYSEFYEPLDYQALYAQIEQLLADHAVLDAAVLKYASGAVGSGMKVTVSNAMRGDTQRVRAQSVVDRINKVAKLADNLTLVAYYLIAYGNDFSQIIVDRDYPKDIIQVKQMPVASMIRLSDDLDQWPDISKAYKQVDVNSQKPEAFFNAGQIVHSRNIHAAGHRYGRSRLLAARRCAFDSLVAMGSLLPRRQANQPFRHLNLKGSADNPLSDTAFKEFQKDFSRKVAMDMGIDVTSPFRDLITNNMDVQVIGGDPEMGTLADIEMLLDAMLATLGMSRQLLGWGTTINRDVLDEQRMELYADQSKFASVLAQQYLLPIYAIGLALNGVHINEVDITIEFAQSLTESQMIKKVSNAREDFKAGALDLRTYLSIIQPYYGFPNIDKVKLAIETEKGVDRGMNQNTLQAPGQHAMSGVPGTSGNQGSIGAGGSGNALPNNPSAVNSSKLVVFDISNPINTYEDLVDASKLAKLAVINSKDVNKAKKFFQAHAGPYSNLLGE